jgi:hypothetical protein
MQQKQNNTFPIHVNDFIDVFDVQDNKWRVGQVLGIKNKCEGDNAYTHQIIEVHFEGWGTRYDTKLPNIPKYIAELRTYTAGYTGQ